MLPAVFLWRESKIVIAPAGIEPGEVSMTEFNEAFHNRLHRQIGTVDHVIVALQILPVVVPQIFLIKSVAGINKGTVKKDAVA